jgi:hypothetical protein
MVATRTNLRIARKWPSATDFRIDKSDIRFYVGTTLHQECLICHCANHATVQRGFDKTCLRALKVPQPSCWSEECFIGQIAAMQAAGFMRPLVLVVRHEPSRDLYNHRIGLVWKSIY